MYYGYDVVSDDTVMTLQQIKTGWVEICETIKRAEREEHGVNESRT